MVQRRADFVARVRQQDVRELCRLQSGLLLPPDLDKLAVDERKHARGLHLFFRPRSAPTRDRLRPCLKAS